MTLTDISGQNLAVGGARAQSGAENLGARMRIRKRRIALGALLVAATFSTPQTQAQAPGYEARERRAIKTTDHCGPAYIQKKVPGAISGPLNWLVDGPFKASCERHDACYRLKEQNQSWCDDRFRNEMYNTCDANPLVRSGVDRYFLCRATATAYYSAVSGTLGSVSYAENEDGGAIEDGDGAGELLNLKRRRIRDIFSDDEFEVCGEIYNPSRIVQEYEVRMVSGGQLVDREPDTHELNVRPGGTAHFCLTTNWSPAWSISDLALYVEIQLWADRPSTYQISGDMVLVAVEEVSKDVF